MDRSGDQSGGGWSDIFDKIWKSKKEWLEEIGIWCNLGFDDGDFDELKQKSWRRGGIRGIISIQRWMGYFWRVHHEKWRLDYQSWTPVAR